jgi:hypothetical protein
VNKDLEGQWNEAVMAEIKVTALLEFSCRNTGKPQNLSIRIDAF